jgi:hypothetical protein
MTKQQKLSEMSWREHPFNFERRERIMDELDDAESRFRECSIGGILMQPDSHSQRRTPSAPS